ncbi:cytochrome P450 CYP12A2-like isoform X2 [Pararge aegeria]|uniref:Jg16588 protein n=1 Tax=Pararge aegeria aegeria TaxID=348720 RepID=A0A8S4R7T9_9NEOP|nr:cytochrome P450 CYP12A2-like isoform X2 [Pararge aegeria]CAH2232805.1 jg16588 [Pararge aegeria aegeria]
MSGFILKRRSYAVASYFRWMRYSSTTNKPFESIPGLSSLPVIGPIHHFLPGIGSVGPSANFFELSKILFEKYGSVVKLDGIFARACLVILYEPEHFDQVYRSEDLEAPSRPGFETLVYYRTELRKSTYDGVYGLTTAQGMQWRDFRTKVNPALLKPKLIKLYTPSLEEIAEDMVARLFRLKDDVALQSNLDLEITKWSLESIAVIALGTRLGCLEDNLTEDHPARVLIKCAKDTTDLALKLEFFPSLWKFYATSNFKKMMKTLDLQWETSVKFIEDAKRIIKDRAHELPEEDKSVIEKLIAIDDKVATVMANEMLFAGIDTVAFTTIALLYNLAIHPEIQDKLREDIRSADKSNRYLKACLKESLRLFPVIPANLRRTTKDHFVAGYHIPKGVDVVAPHEFLSRMDKNYPRATEFIPERWVVEKSDPLYYGNCHPMVTLPFGFGVRSCIGRRIAELEIEVFMKRFIRDVKVTWEGPPIQVTSKVINNFKKPYYFKFETAL